MSKKRFCVICADSKPISDFCDEGDHIIPESMGNTQYKLYCVCDKCNHTLGSRVEQKLATSFISKLFREATSIKGKQGGAGVPSSLEGLYGFDKVGNKYTIHQYGNGKYYAKLISAFKGSLPDTNDERYSVDLDDGTSGSFVLKLDLLLENSTEPLSIDVYINSSDVIDFSDVFCNVAILKIAYGFAIYWFGVEYCEDSVANEIRSVLKSFLDMSSESKQRTTDKAYEVIDSYLRMGDDLYQSMSAFNAFYKGISGGSYVHFVTAFALDGKTNIVVALDGKTPLKVTVGDEKWMECSNTRCEAVVSDGKLIGGDALSQNDSFFHVKL